MAYVNNDFRNKVVERDYSGFVSGTINTTGAMVIVSSQGPNTPILCQSEKDVLTYFGNPSALYPSVFDAIAFCSENACYIASAYATDALFGGVEVSGSAVTAFSAGKTYSTYTFSANTISHTFFSRSPKTDDLAIVIKNSGSTEVFTASLYLRSTYGNALLKTYNYSLTRAKDAAGKSIFIDDVFLDNPYVLVKVNASRSVASYTLTADTPVNFAGGTRGGTPTTSDITTAWGNFNYANKYPCTILMDPIGANEVTVNNIIKNYNPTAFGIIAIQLGKTATTAVTYRKVSVLDSDNCAFYTN